MLSGTRAGLDGDAPMLRQIASGSVISLANIAVHAMPMIVVIQSAASGTIARTASTKSAV